MSNKVQISIEILEKLQNAWEELLKFGEHDGQCDNDETCEHCGSKLRGCSLHMDTTNSRINKMDDVIYEILSTTNPENA